MLIDIVNQALAIVAECPSGLDNYQRDTNEAAAGGCYDDVVVDDDNDEDDGGLSSGTESSCMDGSDEGNSAIRDGEPSRFAKQ